MANILEITIQRRADGTWPVVVEDHRAETLLPVRSEGHLELAEEPLAGSALEYDEQGGNPFTPDELRKLRNR